MGTPVTLLKYGTVREALGFTSMTYMSSGATMYWIFARPSAFKPPQYLLRRGVVYGRGRIDGDGVAGVDARALNVLHYAGDKYVLAVAYRVNLYLDAA